MDRPQDQNLYENFSGYHTHRSERFRHPESSSERNLPENYGNRNRGSWSDMSRSSDRFAQPHRESRQDIAGTYSTSYNYGNMGSYGGAQGFGDIRGGRPSQRHYDSDTHLNFDSGMGSPQHARQEGYAPSGHRSYGYQSDYDSHGMGSSGKESQRESYSSDRFQGSQQDRSEFNTDRNRPSGYSQEQGNYMGSGYNRTTRSEPRGDYGSLGRYESNRYDEPYGMSGFYRGGYGPSGYSEHFERDARDFQRY
ncbi:hypothetical protein [Pontibacter vulgaris]|uniref:hypothetical protein n=1 Tax=Pontibacter vulgaris TaxID=2905679 RepID=UPI001FA8026E|nr:hypothetical protein [Pontibacter vulgaris]